MFEHLWTGPPSGWELLSGHPHVPTCQMCPHVPVFSTKGGRNNYDLMPAYIQVQWNKAQSGRAGYLTPSGFPMGMHRWVRVYIHRKEKIPTLVTRETDSYPALPRALWISVCAQTQAILGLASFTLRSPGTVFT